ncbi:hypothetical protein AGMMS50230_14840 [Spirochaetia bacterium]|nr:hypothetical protein AGMMS50230_14840 [Spirochaetia bacterium]
MKKIIPVLAIFACIFALGSCSMVGSGTVGNLVISIPGAPGVPVAKALTPSPATQAATAYLVTATSGGSTASLSLPVGATSGIMQLTPGTWDIKVDAYLPAGNIHVASGTGQVTIVAGETNHAGIGLVFDNTTPASVTVTYNGTVYTAVATGLTDYYVKITDYSTTSNVDITVIKQVVDQDILLPLPQSAAVYGITGRGQTTTTSPQFTVNANTTEGHSTTMKFGYAIGDTGPAGGKIFYVSDSGFVSSGTIYHYLEAAPADYGTFRYLSGDGNPSAATGTSIGTGLENTNAILAFDPTASAANAVTGYTQGGYSDWFLPSRDEIAELYIQRALVDTRFYVTSSHMGGNNYRRYNAADGTDSSTSNTTVSWVRPIRQF